MPADGTKVQQLEAALERCERFGLANRYASAIMHEVNNPLEAIANLVYLTKVQSHNPVVVAQNMETVEQQLAVLIRVTSQALAFHRKENDSREWDLAEIATSAIKLHAGKINSRGGSVHTKFHDSSPVRVKGSEILQVISNLILNAIDAMPTEDGHIHLRVKRRGRFMHLLVADNGSGIPSHIAPRIFEPYMTSKPQGTGLGLWLSKRIITAHEGRFAVRTTQREGRRGTAFRISIPLGSPSADSSQNADTM